MNPSWAQPVLLRCVPSTTKPPKPKEVMMIVVDSEHHAIKTESLSADKPRKRMTFHIEEMNESMIAGRKLSPKKEFVLELNRKTGHLVETEDAQEPILYDCEAP
jgi:hypothetical protein